MIRQLGHTKERGAVSLFIVIFTALLVTIIAVGFTQLMVRNQQQVLSNDLSQRAYNSAMAGVEDAKRTLIAAIKECRTAGERCNDIREAIDAGKCDTISAAGAVGPQRVDSGGNRETTVGVEGDNQAYTCVKITQDTPNFQGSLTTGTASVVPLRGVDNFNQVRITWFTKADAAQNSDDGDAILAFPNVSPPLKLPPVSNDNWPLNAPPLLRAQYIPGGTALDDLDVQAKSIFLYPQNNGDISMGSSFELDAIDRRRSAHGFPPQQVNCAGSFESEVASAYGVCQATLSLPSSTRSAFLQLAALYSNTSFTVELCNGNCNDENNIVKFNDVQPIVDSTGRADNLFRRVKARVTIKEGVSLPYPDAAISVQNDLCKTFFITDRAADYNPGTCNPAEQSPPPPVE